MLSKSGTEILVVDDDRDGVELVEMLVEETDFRMRAAFNGNEALRLVKSDFFPVILLDIRMPGMDGIEVLKRLKTESPQSVVMLMTAFSNRHNIQQALSEGVFDIIEKPVNNDLLIFKIKNAFRHYEEVMQSRQDRRRIIEEYPYRNIVGKSDKLVDVIRLIDKVAPTDATVLIAGENGTGKELVARAIHDRSGREGLFGAVNAGALPENLLESELFGHEKGAFTGAHEKRIGYFEACDNGTIFLDEIGDISQAMQVKLLRVLQEKEINRLGNTQPVDINARVVAATNRDINKLVKDKVIREDLYYRINTVTIHLPALRERREDIKPLIHHFLKKHSNKKIDFSEGALEALQNYTFPGNIRELEHIVEHAIIFQENGVIQMEHLPPQIFSKQGMSPFEDILSHPWKLAKQMFEMKYLEHILKEASGNISKASRESGIDRSYLQKQIKRYGVGN